MKTLINLPYTECPICNSSELIKWGSYKRNINFIDDNILTYRIITIKRIKCKKCGHTHALIPSFIVPYKVNCLDVILSNINNDEITLFFSFDTIEKWKKDFNRFLPYLNTYFINLSKYQIINKFKQDIFKYYEIFYNYTQKILMMTHKAIVGMAYF